MAPVLFLSVSNVLFLLRQEKYQKNATKGRYENAPPLETPAASPFDARKCSDFRAST